MNNTATASPGERTTGLQEGLIVSLLGFTVVLVVMNTMMFNLALPKIAAEFQLSSVASSWIVTGYSIVLPYRRLPFHACRTLYRFGRCLQPVSLYLVQHRFWDSSAITSLSCSVHA